MPVILLGVLLQGAANALLGDQASLAASLWFTAIAFFAAAVLGQILLRTRRGGTPATRLHWPDVLSLNLTTATTFLGFYLALLWIPASVAAGVESAVGPLAALALMRGRRPTAREVLLAAALLICAIAFALTQRGLDATTFAPTDLLIGVALAAMAGIGMARIADQSHRLGTTGVSAAQILATRYHLTYLVAGVWAATTATTPATTAVSLPELLGLAAAAVVIPLALYQLGMMRTPASVTVSLIALVPGVSFVTEAIIGSASTTPASWITLAALIILVAINGRRHAAARTRVRPAPAESEVTRPSE